MCYTGVRNQQYVISFACGEKIGQPRGQEVSAVERGDGFFAPADVGRLRVGFFIVFADLTNKQDCDIVPACNRAP